MRAAAKQGPGAGRIGRGARTWVTLAAVALLAAGCTDDGDADGAKGGKEKVDTVARLDTLAASTSETSARITAHLGPVEDHGMSLEGDGEGIVDFAAGTSESRYRVTTAAVVPPGAVDEGYVSSETVIEQRSIAGHRYSRFTLDGAEPGGWSDDGQDEFDDSEPPDGYAEDRWTQLEDMLNDPTQFDPTRFLEIVTEGAVSVREAGSADVRGERTTHWVAQLPDGALDDTDYHGASQVEVWVDGEHRARRVVAGPLTMELYDFGVAVDVPVPDHIAQSSFGDFLPRTTLGAWSRQSAGATAGIPWEVFVAPGDVAGRSTTCRTFEADLPTVPMPDPFDELAPGETTAEEDPAEVTVPEEAPELPDEVTAVFDAMPKHGKVFATCGDGYLTPFSSTRLRPVVQLLTAGSSTIGLALGGEIPSPDAPELVAFAISADHPTRSLRVEFADGSTAALPVDGSGVVVWDATAAGAIRRLVLVDSGISCAVGQDGLYEPDADAGSEDGSGDEVAPEEGEDTVDSGNPDDEWLNWGPRSEAVQSLAGGLEPCVRS